MGDKDDEPFRPEFESIEDELLHSARHGNSKQVLELVLRKENGDVILNINCKGKKKFNRGWTPLHMASYFGHYDTVKVLLQNGADVNIVNSVGDTPLHQAAHTGREDVLTVLLEFGANLSAVNSESQQPKHLARHPDIKRLIEAAEHHENRQQEEEFLQASAVGNMGAVTDLLKPGKGVSINCTDRFGNTALHIAALREKKEVAVFLLQNGIDTNIKNNNGQSAAEVTRTQPMKQVLGVQGVKSLQLQPQRLEGTLLKKSRILGFRPVWTILDRGVLSYFENRGDASTGSKRKGMKYLDEAKVLVPSSTGLDMKLCFSDGTMHTLSADPVNGGLVTKQKWLNALSEHIVYSTHYTHQGGQQNEYDKEIVPLGTMQEALQTSQAHQKLLQQQMKSLSKLVVSVQSPNPTDSSTREDELKRMGEAVEGIQSTSRDMCTALSHCMTLFSQQEEVRQLQLQEEGEKSRVLQEALHALATEHHELEKSITTSHKPSHRYYDTDDDEFYDCSDDGGDDEPFGSPRYDSFADALSQEFESSSTSNGRPNVTAKPWGSTKHFKRYIPPNMPNGKWEESFIRDGEMIRTCYNLKKS